MKKLFFKYQTMLGTIFSLWLFLAIIKKLGFDFSVNISVFFRILLFLFVIWLVWLTKINWSQVYAVLKKTWENVKDNFIIETKETQKEIIRFSPSFLTGKIGSFLSFFLAFLFSLFLLPWQVLKKIFKEYVFNQITLIILVILGILIDIFVFKFTSDFIILFLTGLWVLSIYRFKFEGRVSIGFALFFLILCPFLLILGKEPIAEKVAIWAYMFLVVGVIQMFIEYIREGKRDAKIKEK